MQNCETMVPEVANILQQPPQPHLYSEPCLLRLTLSAIQSLYRSHFLRCTFWPPCLCSAHGVQEHGCSTEQLTTRAKQSSAQLSLPPHFLSAIPPNLINDLTSLSLLARDYDSVRWTDNVHVILSFAQSLTPWVLRP